MQRATKSEPPPKRDAPPLDRGEAGASAKRAYEARRDGRESRVRGTHPRTAGLRLALGTAPQHETRWEVGAHGEELVATSLERRAGDRCILLHDRGIPGSRANIDHIAIAPSGVWVIDAKAYKGKVEVRKPWRGEAKLFIGGRDRSKLGDGLDRQVSLVRAAVERTDPGVAVHGALCFIDTDLPLLRTLTFRGYPLLWRKQMAKRLRADGPLGDEAIAPLAQELAREFPPA